MLESTIDCTDSECSQRQDLERILIPRADIARRVAELGKQITADYQGRELVLICILKGGLPFTADLMRAIDLPVSLEVVGASAYKGGTSAAARLRITKDVDHDMAGRHVLLVEDVYDTGKTLAVMHELLGLHQPASLEICSLLRKDKPRAQELPIRYVGFDVEDVFVVGYGLDYKERYRNLPCIGVLKSEIYKE
ncbi:MAG: hypoxanthine phosphoribosyltransferase [Candidatus Sumerlaeia bacterium]